VRADDDGPPTFAEDRNVVRGLLVGHVPVRVRDHGLAGLRSNCAYAQVVVWFSASFCEITRFELS
jgi:hypothetical protein